MWATLSRSCWGTVMVLPVHGKPDEPAIRILVRATRGGHGPLALVPALVLNDPTGRPTTPAEAVLERSGKMERAVAEKEIQRAMREPPQTTRAKLRGDFIRHAKQKRRDYTVDWVHLKLNDQAQRTVLCKDPFRAVDERVEQLIAHM